MYLQLCFSLNNFDIVFPRRYFHRRHHYLPPFAFPRGLLLEIDLAIPAPSKGEKVVRRGRRCVLSRGVAAHERSAIILRHSRRAQDAGGGSVRNARRPGVIASSHPAAIQCFGFLIFDLSSVFGERGGDFFCFVVKLLGSCWRNDHYSCSRCFCNRLRRRRPGISRRSRFDVGWKDASCRGNRGAW